MIFRFKSKLWKCCLCLWCWCCLFFNSEFLFGMRNTSNMWIQYPKAANETFQMIIYVDLNNDKRIVLFAISINLPRPGLLQWQGLQRWADYPLIASRMYLCSHFVLHLPGYILPGCQIFCNTIMANFGPEL